MKILWIFFGGLRKIGLYLGVIPMHFGVFLKVNVQNGGYFLGLLKFHIFFGVLEIPDIFGVNGKCWAQAYVCRKNESIPPWESDMQVDIFSGFRDISAPNKLGP